MPAGSDSTASSSGGDPVAPYPDLRDRAAFEAFYRRHFKPTRAFFVRRRFSPAEADELAQQVFMRAWRKRVGYRGDGPPEAWLSRITSNVWKNELRRRSALQRQADEEELDQRVEDTAYEPLFSAVDPEPEEQAVSAEAVRKVRGALTRLPDGQRLCLEMRLGSDLTYREIADTLGLAPGTVQSQVHDAKARLKEMLAADYGDTDPPRRDG